jgi:hypothetical protein
MNHHACPSHVKRHAGNYGTTPDVSYGTPDAGPRLLDALWIKPLAWDFVGTGELQGRLIDIHRTLNFSLIKIMPEAGNDRYDHTVPGLAQPSRGYPLQVHARQ